MIKHNDLTIRFGGEGGEGIISSGDMVAQAAAKSGLEVLTFKTFPAEIKGGYAMYQVRFSKDQILSEGSSFQALVAFNKEALEVNRSSLAKGSALVYDYPGGDIEEEQKIDGVFCYPVPMSKIAKELGSYRAKNMVSMGAVTTLFELPLDSIIDTINQKFARKGEKVVELNLRGVAAGKKYVEENLTKSDPFRMSSGSPKGNEIIISGNDAVGLGALLGGCSFFSAYPITPATEVANFLSKHLPKTGGDLVQAEDEIASLANVIGASFGGAKSMTSTSGPGLSLMQELIGLASMMELPVVICDVQRGGPSTGLPTKHEQSDLLLAALGCHGDASKVVISPEGVEDCVYLTIEAFNIAEHYQIPVIILSDGSLGFRTASIKVPDTSKIKLENRKAWDGNLKGSPRFLRYEHTESSISPVSAPGMVGGAYISTGLEHGEDSAPKYSAQNHVDMIDKRFNKLNDIEDYFQDTESDCEDGASVGIICFGSTIGVVREAVSLAREEGVKVSSIYPKLIWPLPMKALESFINSHDKILIPEVNAQGQLAALIKTKINFNPISYTIYGGLPFTPNMILEKIKEVQ
ncbi:MAG: 2-oxoacid:acceptor oxidoreductase subunit alpha [Nitrospinota bacterium]